jgi:hypothetical protein
MNRADFQALADVRLAEATALVTLTPPLPDAAYYLAGYAVECGLKACIAKRVNQHDFPDKQLTADSYSHNVDTLLRAADLVAVLAADFNSNPNLGDNWEVVRNWSERSRYERHSLAKAQELIDAVAHATDGVLTWIKGNW